MANSKRKCRFCKSYKLLADGFVTPSNAFFCNREHATQYAYPKGKAIQAKEDKSRLRARKAQLKPKTQKLNDLQALVNKYIRLRDQEKPCISCGRPNDQSHQRHASHYKSVGSNSNLRFYTLNIHASCAQCNSSQSGNIINYRIGLIERHSLELVEALEDAPRSRRYSEEWIERAKKVFRLKISKINALH